VVALWTPCLPNGSDVSVVISGMGHDKAQDFNVICGYCAAAAALVGNLNMINQGLRMIF
jgi:hypothetical protein